MTESTASMESVRSPGAANLNVDRFERIYVWELPVRLAHWINVVCIVVLFSTGLYIAHPVLVTSGEAWNNFAMGRVREVHFATAFIFTINFLWRITWAWIGNRYARSGLPRPWSGDWWRRVSRQMSLYLRLETGAPDLGHNDMAGLFYTLFMLLLGFAQIVTGFALYSQSSPGGFWDGLVGWVPPLLGGAYNTVMWHHLFAWGFVFFAILHIYMVLLDGREFRNGMIGAMIHGHKFRLLSREDERED